MDKQTFLTRLRKALSGLPAQDIQKHIEYYTEMIDDRMEDGLTEAEAVAAVGDPEALAAQLLAETPKTKKESLPVWAIVLLIVGSPIWISLLAAAFSVVISVYATLWAVLISLYTVPISLGAVAVAGVVCGTVFLFTGRFSLAAAFVGMGLACAGLCMFSFWLCNLAAKGTVWLTKWIFNTICSLFRKERAK